MAEKPRASPRPPDDSAPLSLEKTPSRFPVVVEFPMIAAFVQRRLSEQGVGKPVISPKLTPWALGGLILCGAVSNVLTGDPDVPLLVVKVANIGTLFFTGLLGIGTGWRK